MDTKLPGFEGNLPETAQLKLTGGANERVGAWHYQEEGFAIIKFRVGKISHGPVTVNKEQLYARIHEAGIVALEIVERNQGEKMLDEARIMADERFGLYSIFGEKAQPAEGFGEGETSPEG